MKKILSVVTAAVIMMTFTGCPEKEAKSSGSKGPGKEVLSLYEKSKELKRRESIPYAVYEETFLDKEELAERWNINTGSESPTGTDETGINDIAGIYIGYVPVPPANIHEALMAYIYLGKNPDENNLYPAYIYYTDTNYNFNYKEESSYLEKYNRELSLTHIGSWSIKKTVSGQNGSNTETVIRITLPEESKRNWNCQLKNDQPAGFTEKSEWIHDLGYPYILDGKKTIVSNDGIYIKMD